MKNSKKGISLIVLIITIVVIIILAAAVILTIGNNNPVDSANKAVADNDLANVKDAASIYVFSYMANNDGVSPIGADPATVGPKTLPEAVDSYPKTAISWADLGLTEPNSLKNKIVKINSNGLVTITDKPA